jgi:DNA-binding NarL/FixJ family response regulator
MKEAQEQKKYNILIVDNECDKEEITGLISYLESKYIPSSKIHHAFTESSMPCLPSKFNSIKKDDFVISCKSNKYIEDALQAFKYDVGSIDFILLDINFGRSGEMAGIKFLKEIRLTDPYLPVCIITQHKDDFYAYQAGKNMASFYVSKKDLFDDYAILDQYILEAKKNEWFLYNRKLMKIVNEKLAKTYDEEEYSKPGTVAFCYWEDEVILKAAKEIKER